MAPQSIIVREWVSIPIESEFRGVVIDGKLRGLSQYSEILTYQNFDSRAREWSAKILRFWQRIKPLVPFKNCVADFAVIDDRVYIVEFNPLDCYTGRAMFVNDDFITMTDPNHDQLVLRYRIEDSPRIIQFEWSELISKVTGEVIAERRIAFAVAVAIAAQFAVSLCSIFR
jgi:hypothetical protein